MPLSELETFSKQIIGFSSAQSFNLKTSNRLSRPQGAVESQVRENWAHRTRDSGSKAPPVPVLSEPSCLIWTNLSPSRESCLID